MEETNSSNSMSTTIKPDHQKQSALGMRKTLPLSELAPGQLAEILRVGGDKIARLRFMEMGFIRGETVYVERVAPMGDPIEYRIKGYHLSLRRADAHRIRVQAIIRELND